MAVINVAVPTLIDITTNQDPNGVRAKVAEILNRDQPSIQDMPWKEGNLQTGERVTVRSSLPSVDFRRLNEGVARSKSTTSQFDEAAALLEANAIIDRKLAILSGNVAATRALEDKAFIEAMGQRFASTLWYGNQLTANKEFTGLTPRFNTIAGGQVIDGGGTGTDNSSIWIINWDVDTVYGIYPKNTVGGLHYAETTANMRDFGDGFPTGDYQRDDNGNPYLCYSSHYEWNCGLAVRDRRQVVRIANIDKSLLSKDQSSGADLQDLLLLGLGLLHRVGPNTKIYMPRNIMTTAWRQSAYEKRNFFDRQTSPGQQPMLNFNGVQVRREDALIADEARVV